METQFKQKAKVGVAGSFINQMMSNNSTLPEVGKGATQMHYSDRSVFEVIEVSEDKKTVKLESLRAVGNGENLPMGHQEWKFEPTGHYITVVWKWKAWRQKIRVVKFTEEFIEKAQEFSLAKSLTPEQRQEVYAGEVRPQNVVEGITYETFEYPKMKLIFGSKDYYYDWSF